MEKIKIIKSKRKTAVIQIKNAQVIVRVPLYMKKADINNFIESHQDWIKNKLMLSAKRERALSKIQPLSDAELCELVKTAKRIIPEKAKYFSNLLGVSYGRISIRKQRTRWGSCSAAGNLNFNCLLILAPDFVLDGVVAHEMCHLKHMNHSKAFYDELLAVYPSYNDCKKWLVQNGAALQKRLDNNVDFTE